LPPQDVHPLGHTDAGALVQKLYGHHLETLARERIARKIEAERWLRSQQVSVDRGSHIDPRDTERRFSDVVDAWRLTWLELEPKTKAGYESI
jgi:hypothetical protein